MAKRNRKKLKTVIKVIVIMLAILAIAYVITALAYGRVWDPRKWINKDKPIEDTNITELTACNVINDKKMAACSVYSDAVSLSESYNTYFMPTYHKQESYTDGVKTLQNLFSESPSDCDRFEYVLAVVFAPGDKALPSQSSEMSNGLFFYTSDYSTALVINSNTRENMYGSIICSKKLSFGNYDGNSFEHNFERSDTGYIYDDLYLTITQDKAFFSYFGYYASVEKSEYLDSLNNILVSYDSSESEYARLKEVVCSGLNFDTTDSLVRVDSWITTYEEVSAPTKEGYSFSGWYYDEACTQPYRGEPITMDTNLYAGFSKITYNVSLDCSALEHDQDDIGFYNRVVQVEYGNTLSYVPDPVEGLTFVGWYYEDGNMYENTVITGDTTLIGRWTATVYTITCDLNDGAGSINTVTVLHGDVPTIPVPVRKNYKFVGWEGYGVFPCSPDVPTFADITLLAHWEYNVFTVTFYVNQEIYKQVQVEGGKTLAGVIIEEEIESKNIVSYCNVNKATEVMPFVQFKIEDDVSVYLAGLKSDVDNGGDSNGDNNSGDDSTDKNGADNNGDNNNGNDNTNNNGADDKGNSGDSGDSNGTDGSEDVITSINSKVKSVWTKVKDFFKSVGHFFVLNWLYITIPVVAIIAIIVIGIVAYNRKR